MLTEVLLHSFFHQDLDNQYYSSLTKIYSQAEASCEYEKELHDVPDGETHVPLEDVLKMCPNIFNFQSDPTEITPITSKFLQNTEMEHKLKEFKLLQCSGLLDIQMFKAFLKKNANESTITEITFASNVDPEEVEKFQDNLNIDRN